RCSWKSSRLTGATQHPRFATAGSFCLSSQHSAFPTLSPPSSPFSAYLSSASRSIHSITSLRPWWNAPHFITSQRRAKLSTQDALQFLPATDFLVRSSVPVITGAGRDLKWDTQAYRCIHLPLHNLPHHGELTRSNFDDQFVMHLQQHT